MQTPFPVSPEPSTRCSTSAAHCNAGNEGTNACSAARHTVPRAHTHPASPPGLPPSQLFLFLFALLTCCSSLGCLLLSHSPDSLGKLLSDQDFNTFPASRSQLHPSPKLLRALDPFITTFWVSRCSRSTSKRYKVNSSAVPSQPSVLLKYLWQQIHPTI